MIQNRAPLRSSGAEASRAAEVGGDLQGSLVRPPAQRQAGRRGWSGPSPAGSGCSPEDGGSPASEGPFRCSSSSGAASPGAGMQNSRCWDGKRRMHPWCYYLYGIEKHVWSNQHGILNGFAYFCSPHGTDCTNARAARTLMLAHCPCCTHYF